MMSDVFQVTTFTEEQQQQQPPSTADSNKSSEQQGRVMMTASVPLGDLTFDASKMRHDSTATSRNLLADGLSSNLACMQPHEGTKNKDSIFDEKAQVLNISNLNETAANGAQPAYSPFTTPDSQPNLFYYSSTGTGYTGPVAYYSTADGGNYFPVEGHTAAALYPIQQNDDASLFQWHVDSNRWSHRHQQQPYSYDYDWSAQEGGSEGHVAIKEEPYDDSSLLRTLVNFDHSHLPPKHANSTSGSGQEVATKEDNFVKKEFHDQEFAPIEDLVSRHLFLLPSPVDKNAPSHMTAHYSHMPEIRSRSSTTTLCHQQPLPTPAPLLDHPRQATSSKRKLSAQISPSTSTVGSIEVSQVQNVDRKANGTYTLAGEKIRRPPNAFMIYAKERRREILYSNRELTNKEVSKVLGVEWHALPEEVKAKYKRTSEVLRHEHQLKYPGYYYSPIEARREKEERMRKFEEKRNASNKRKKEAINTKQMSYF